MVAQERLATFRLAVALLTLALFAALVPCVGAGRAQGAFGLLAVLAIEPFVFGPKRVGGWDERDRAIHLRSLQISSTLVALLATAALWITYYAHQQAGTISVALLPWAAWSGWIVFLLLQSMSVLVLYRRS